MSRTDNAWIREIKKTAVKYRKKHKKSREEKHKKSKKEKRHSRKKGRGNYVRKNGVLTRKGATARAIRYLE